MNSRRPTIVTLATLLAAILLVSSLQAPGTPPVARAPETTPAPPRFVHSSAGFDIEVPAGWSAIVDERTTNRAVHRLLLLGNRGLEAPELAPSSWPGVPNDRVIVELVQYFGPPPLPSRTVTETPLPLDWANAQDFPPDGAFAVRALGFSHLGRGLGFRVHIGPDAPTRDLAQLPALVASLRPEPIPSTGVYRGWRVVGPIDAYTVGSVVHFEAQDSMRYGFFLVRGSQTVFAHIDQANVFYGGMKPCPIAYDGATRSFFCPRSGERWSRVGAPLVGMDSFGLAYHPVVIKDGLVLVGGSSVGGRARESEQSEFADAAIPPPPRTAPFTRAEILARYAQITSVDPIERSAAKLVSGDALAKSGLFPGFTPPAGRVWVVMFVGTVRSPQAGDPFGMATLFVADPLTGGLITWRCCEPLAGFDPPPDLSG